METMGKRILDNLKNNKYNKVSFLLGAGVSTAAGIPDFRSNDGIYKKIKDKYDLEDPSMIFNIHFFKQNPHIYYDYLHHRVNIDSKEPTKTHLFMKTFQDSNKLNLIYTQNIDCLEYKAGINPEFIVQCHGNYRKIVCSECNKEHSYEKFNEHREKKIVYYCDFCNTAPCKPAVTFFGEPLPQDFYEKKDDIVLSDLVFVIGTSLKVSPFNSLITSIKKFNDKAKSEDKIDIILINKENSIKNVLADDDSCTKENFLFIQGEADKGILVIEEHIANSKGI